MKHHAELAHHVPGRLRIKIPAARDNPPLLQSAKQVFDGMPGIDSVFIRPNSASLVLQYDPRLESEMEARFAGYRQTTTTRTEVARQASANGGAESISHPERPGDEVEEWARQIEVEAAFLSERSQWAKLAVDCFKGLDKEIRIASGDTIDLKIVLALGLAVVTFVGIGAEAATPMWVTLALFALNHFMEQHQPSAVQSQTQTSPVRAAARA